MLQIDQLGWPNVRLVNPGPRLQSSGLFDSQLTAISYTNQILYHVNFELDTCCTVCVLVRSLTLNFVTSQSLFRCQSCNLVICGVNLYNFSNILALMAIRFQTDLFYFQWASSWCTLCFIPLISI